MERVLFDLYRLDHGLLTGTEDHGWLIGNWVFRAVVLTELSTRAKIELYSVPVMLGQGLSGSEHSRTALAPTCHQAAT